MRSGPFGSYVATPMLAVIGRSTVPHVIGLAAMARRLELRTLVNLRGACENGSDALTRAQRHQCDDPAPQARSAPKTNPVTR